MHGLGTAFAYTLDLCAWLYDFTFVRIILVIVVIAVGLSAAMMVFTLLTVVIGLAAAKRSLVDDGSAFPVDLDDDGYDDGSEIENV